MNVSARTLITSVLAAWLLAAIALSATGLLATLHPPAPQVIILVLTLTSLAVAKWIPSVRTSIDRADPRVLVALHVSRLVVGIAFLVLAARGGLPTAFALPAGYGDIAVGLAATALICSVRPSSASSRTLYRAWNICGLADILFVVANAARIGLTAPAPMAPLLHPPLSLLPTFLVPLIITTHVLLFRRLR